MLRETLRPHTMFHKTSIFHQSQTSNHSIIHAHLPSPPNSPPSSPPSLPTLHIHRPLPHLLPPILPSSNTLPGPEIPPIANPTLTSNQSRSICSRHLSPRLNDHHLFRFSCHDPRFFFLVRLHVFCGYIRSPTYRTCGFAEDEP
jgi:hypothetical protein